MIIDFDDVDTWPRGIYTCRTDGCENAGVQIVLAVPQPPLEHTVICGACNRTIHDRAVATEGTALGAINPSPPDLEPTAPE